MHNLNLIVTLSAALGSALVLGFITQRLKLSPIVGYLMAGILIGPFTPGFVADAAIAAQFAEIGVILLMFGVGLHFHLKDLIAVKSVAVPGAVAQSLVATILGTATALWSGWTFGAGLVLGIGISVASTVVLIRGLEDTNQLDSPQGHIAVGWLVVEDIFTVLVLVLLPALAQLNSDSGQSGMAIAMALGMALLKMAIFAVLVLVIGGKVIPWILTLVAQTRSRELFTLSVLVLALTIAIGASIGFDVSVALGAFLAGMVVGQSKVSHQAAADALPMRDAFAVLFFVSVGMLFDPRFLVQEPGLVLATLGIILLGKPLIALLIVILLGHSVRTALTVAIGLSQIGEFSFILADLGQKLKVLPSQGYSVLVAGALLSISLNPVLFRLIDPVEQQLRKRRTLWNFLNRRSQKLGQEINEQTREQAAASQEKIQAIVVGYGPVGQSVTRILSEFEIHPTIVDSNVDTTARVSAEGHRVIYGDATRAEILKAAGIEKARYLIVTVPGTLTHIPIILSARELNPDIRILVRAHYLAERVTLEEMGASAACFEEAEAAVALAELVLREVGAPQDRIDSEAKKIRDELAPRKL